MNPNLLFSGNGVRAVDLGGRRAALGAVQGKRLPVGAVRDIVVHPRESRPGAGDARPRYLDRRRYLTVASLTPESDDEGSGADSGPPGPVFGAQWRMAEGDEHSAAPAAQTDAQITYYQKSRHIFGDLKIEILDQNGKVVDTVAGSKHRGVNRATWSMRLKPPAVPPAATALFEAAQGPRVLPGTYTVKMTKGDKVYTEQTEMCSIRARSSPLRIGRRSSTWR